MTCTPVAGTPDYVWFNPLSYLADLIGTEDPVYQYWFSVIGDQVPTQVLNVAAFCAAGPQPVYPCDATDIQAYGPNAVLYSQVVDLLFNSICECV